MSVTKGVNNMKQNLMEIAKKYMLTCPNAKVQYRFSQVSNFITFEQYVDEKLNSLNAKNLLEKYCQQNRLV